MVLPWPGVQSQVGELRSRMLCAKAKKSIDQSWFKKRGGIKISKSGERHTSTDSRSCCFSQVWLFVITWTLNLIKEKIDYVSTVSENYEATIKKKKKKTDDPIRKWAKELNRHFSKKLEIELPYDPAIPLLGPPVSSVDGILQERILKWVAMPSSRGCSWSRDQTHISYQVFTTSATFKKLSQTQRWLNQRNT